MTPSDAIAYFTTLIAIAVAPGPVVLMLLARAGAGDTRGACAFGGGFALGGVVIIVAVCAGLGHWLKARPALFEYGRFAVLAYLG